MRRDILKHIDEARRWFRADRRRAAAIDMSVTELKYFYDRIEGGEHPVEALCDMWRFCFRCGVSCRSEKKRKGCRRMRAASLQKMKHSP